MMKSLNNLITFFILFILLQACVASNTSSGRKSLASPVKTPAGNTPASPVFNSTDSLYWYNSIKVSGTMTLNLNTDLVVYLRGSNVHNFLSSKDGSGVEYYRKNYCLIGNYGGTNKQLRVRAVPIFINNFSTNSIERILRIDIPSQAENTAACGVSTIDGATPLSSAYALFEICPACTGGTSLTSINLKLYEKTSVLNEAPLNLISLTSLALRIDLSSNSSSPISSCSNSSCEAKGFNCCISGQCVNDGTQKSNASLDPQFNQAMSDYALNPLSFINYPNIFNVCANIAHVPVNTTLPPTTPTSDAQQRVATYLADYSCIDKVEKTGLFSLCLPGANETQFLSTKKKLALACGCPATYDDETRAIKCPDWGVKPIYNSPVEILSNIVDFYCYTPQPVNPIGPITNLNVSVSNRSAPHRFYSSGGTNYDVLTGVSSTVIQEGDDFFYLDNVFKASPQNGLFNMNSILGRMDIALSHTAPAKMVNVELGRTYILSTTSGFFTPCPKCAKDSWYQTFSAHPATTGGVGLRASGFTTSRDSFSANATLGNYEDTKFGRACYLPPTMIPFSHKKENDLQTQRLNRLKTQAAFYINGYQRDWFGFNKGAMIGSFDGVTWFAIGSGRRVTATSSRLYLAINGAFLDLADNTNSVVNIIPDLSGNITSGVDYDPELTMSDPKQNMAGSCQQYHQCANDADCVTQLGWEYTCADVSQLKSHWPISDTDAKELPNQEKTATLFEILEGTTTIGQSGKRCVYRGAGAPCVRDFTSLDGNFNQKALTCAPNFYCAALTTNKFNDELVRSPNEFDDILFGMDTNVLGRPLNYVTGNKTLLAEIVDNIKYNGGAQGIGLTQPQVDDMGICRPGRSLSSIPSIAHSTPDAQKRTDYISQIASCNSKATGIVNRIGSCPAFGDDLDYIPHATPNSEDIKVLQNSCGGEAQNPTLLISSFKGIEGDTLQLLGNITQPILAADACLRRAGSPCFSDLDCGPNKLHADIVSSMPLSNFGGTQAEQNYWQENLVCGQGAPLPILGSAAYSKYNLTENRCCRAIGKDFTMFTSGPATIVPENMGTNVTLDTKKFSIIDPKANNRYSRYTISPTATNFLTTSSTPSVSAGITPEKNQWRVINETGSLTCCGGGWVRKFADGTHNWSIKNRLTLETSNFSCLNFRSPLAAFDYNGFGDAQDEIVQSTYQRDYEFFCKSPFQNGCMQILYRDVSGFTIFPPLLYDPADAKNIEPDVFSVVPAWATAPPYSPLGQYQPSPAVGNTRLDTGPEGDIESGNFTFKMNQDVPYQPFAYTFTQFPYDLFTFTDGSKSALTWFSDKDIDYGVSMYLPAYIPYNMATRTARISAIYIKYLYDDNRQEVVNITAFQDLDLARCDGVANYPPAVPSGQPIDSINTSDFESWCVSHNSKTQNRPMINVKAYTGPNPLRQWKYASVIIDFQPLERKKGIRTTTPGNPYYYLTKLGRLELLGIPQITYEPLYCNNNQDNLVPGIFSSNIKTRAQFLAASSAYSYDPLFNYDEDGTSEADSTPNVGNNGNRFTFQDKLAHPAVFSAKDFACCTPLGKETASGATCCSGFSTTANGKTTCKLPTGTDLHVYFNKFVSNEGVGDEQPGGGLSLSTIANEDASDFNEYTGEPKMRTSTFAKLEELGKAYCQKGIVGNGGSFGLFPPEPSTGTYFAPTGTNSATFPLSIVDSILDSEGPGSITGKFPFDNGFRWDHHYYCK